MVILQKMVKIKNPNLFIFSMQVSSDILRAQGYTQQFKNLLSSGPRARRDSVPGSASAAALGNVSKPQQQQKDGQQRGAFSQQQSLGDFFFVFLVKFLDFVLSFSLSFSQNPSKIHLLICPCFSFCYSWLNPFTSFALIGLKI